jgi:hypothetical protein
MLTNSGKESVNSTLMTPMRRISADKTEKDRRRSAAIRVIGVLLTRGPM